MLKNFIVKFVEEQETMSKFAELKKRSTSELENILWVINSVETNYKIGLITLAEKEELLQDCKNRKTA